MNTIETIIFLKVVHSYKPVLLYVLQLEILSELLFLKNLATVVEGTYIGTVSSKMELNRYFKNKNGM